MRRMMQYRKTVAALIAVFCVMLFGAGSCDSGPAESDGQRAENASRLSGYNLLVKNQPAESMNGYSPTRESKNFWIKRWRERGKVAYIYLMSNGTPWSYAIIKRLPVNYCTSLIPPLQKVSVDMGEYGGETYIPGPSVDGTFASGGDCQRYYGEDAVTGAYVEWTAGNDSTMLVRDQPLPLNALGGAIPLGDATAEKTMHLND